MKKGFAGNWVLLVLCVLAIESVGFLSSIFNANSINGWYASLEKISFHPPNWVFGPVWTFLYFLIGVSLFLFIGEDKKQKSKISGYWIFSLQILLNGAWSFVFFGVQQIGGALITLILLWLAIIANFIVFYKISKPAALLLVPYWLWVSFAGILNFSIWILNK